MLGTGEYHTADQVLGCAEACQRLAVSPRWSWAAIPHASSRVRPPTSHISTHTYSTFCLGPMNTLLCVCLPCAVSTCHLGLRPHKADPNSRCLSRLSSRNTPSYSSALQSSRTYPSYGMARVPELSHQGSTAGLTDTYRSAHCMTFPCSYPL